MNRTVFVSFVSVCPHLVRCYTAHRILISGVSSDADDAPRLRGTQLYTSIVFDFLEKRKRKQKQADTIVDAQLAGQLMA